MPSPSKAGREEPTVAVLLIFGCLLPPGLWIWSEAGRPWWLPYLAWLACILGVGLLRWRGRA